LKNQIFHKMKEKKLVQIVKAFPSKEECMEENVEIRYCRYYKHRRCELTCTYARILLERERLEYFYNGA